MNKTIQSSIVALALLGSPLQSQAQTNSFPQPDIGTVVRTDFSHDIVCNRKGIADLTGYPTQTGLQYFKTDSNGKVAFNNEKPMGNPYAFLEYKSGKLYINLDLEADGFEYSSKKGKDICEDFLLGKPEQI